MRQKKLWNYIWPLLALSLICFAKPLVRKVTGNFTVHKILRHFPSDPRWVAEPLVSDEKIREILSQKFYYFGKGSQCYAFLSEDGQYVIKFINQKHHDRHKKSRERDLSSNFVAFQELKEETGLLMIHFCSEKPLHQSLTIVDGSHIAHTIDLDGVEFLLQRRMRMPFDVIEQAMRQNKEDDAKKALDEIFAFLRSRLDRGLLDYDPKIYTNYGFIGEKVYQLDSGQVAKAHRMEDYKKELKHFRVRNRRTLRWFEENYPSLLPFYLSHMDSLEKHYQHCIAQQVSDK